MDKGIKKMDKEIKKILDAHFAGEHLPKTMWEKIVDCIAEIEEYIINKNNPESGNSELND
jgi:hypothetical protein